MTNFNNYSELLDFHRIGVEFPNGEFDSMHRALVSIDSGEPVRAFTEADVARGFTFTNEYGEPSDMDDVNEVVAAYNLEYHGVPA